jgi:hypothetical protein
VPAFTFGAPVPAPAPPQTLPADGGPAAPDFLADAPPLATQAGATQAFATQAGATPALATTAAQGTPAHVAPTNALSAARRPFMLPAQRSTFTVAPLHLIPPGSAHPFNCSDPLLQIAANCPLVDFLSTGTDFVNDVGQLSLLRAQLLLGSSLQLGLGVSVPFGATITVATLGRIAYLLAPGVLNMVPPRSNLGLVAAVAFLTRNLRHGLSPFCLTACGFVL